MEIVKYDTNISPMTNAQIEIATEAENAIRTELNIIRCCTEHTLHAGIYSRTLFMPRGSIVAGVVIKVPTTLVLCGKMAVYIGDEVKHIDGYNVLTTLGDRKQVVYAIEDSYATLSFRTDAKTIDEAEQQMTNEYERLMSREPESINIINVTGV